MSRHRAQALENVSQMRDNRAAPWMIGALRGQIDRGFRWLRFEPALEREFFAYLNSSARMNRLALLIIAATSLLISPLLDSWLLWVPGGTPPLMWLIEYGVMQPVLVLSFLWCLLRRESCATELIMTGQFVVVSAGLVVNRVVLAHAGADFPVEFVGVGLIGMAALARVRAIIMVPVGIALSIAVLLTEVLIVSPPMAAYYHLAAAGTLGLMAAYILCASEYYLRASWLDRRLLELVSRRDGLTGLFNRHALESALTVAHAHAVRDGLGYGVAMIDIDQFGRYNNAYGHPAGDQALREAAQMIESYARRPLDVCGRYGGEEFTAFWIDESPDRIQDHAENLRAAIQALNIPHKRSKVEPVLTVSVGVCYVYAPQPDDSLSAVLATADRLLYKAKRGGRNQVCSGVYESLSRPALADMADS